ncbi:MATE family efflux transporter [Acutalibacter muris]|jgi:putative MATE family efflux protein|uniref:Multidrug export protein MepA n=1 Tax=Acutalibacter muris TaxID=1796620 RepID=A0A1Z2XNS7_9FIRM|nr:MATE family efflux transporter [Acutalibacter muris]ANU53230.1 MATE family efflux transporter [Hungateiclostridiaceae bacterium KB18]ASB40096.1 MATE family efflux transporter [Acutalibacter muris]QQR29385.1 MATE family efflux transporter [Acutalibacter muris]
MKIQLSDRFTYSKLFRFTLPSVIMMVFTSIYGVVDGFFVSNFVGKTPFAAVNFIMPVLMILGTVGFMFGAGGSALIARTMGEGDSERARRLFSLFVYVTVALGVVLGAFGFIFIRPIAVWLGAKGEMLENCVLYARIILPALPALMLQYEFQSFFITAERPQLGLMVTVIAGMANMVLDALFTAVLPFGLAGAASATAISQSLGGIIPLFYFGRRNSSRLRLCRTVLDWKALLKACTNGSSELMSNISMSIVGMLYNAQLLHYAGEDGVAAYGVLMYVSMIFMAIFIGYSTGVAPVVSFHFGADGREELRSLYRKSIVIILSASAAMLGLAEALARPLSAVFVGYDPDLFRMTVGAFGIYSFSFLFSGIAIFGSAFFTALNDGLTSALISFLRTLVFQVAAVLIFPLIWGIDGIWLSIVAAEVMAAVVTLAFLGGKRRRFHY